MTDDEKPDKPGLSLKSRFPRVFEYYGRKGIQVEEAGEMVAFVTMVSVVYKTADEMRELDAQLDELIANEPPRLP